MTSKAMDVFDETERKATDVPFLFVKGIFFLIVIGFLGYCYANSDVHRLTVGYDDCGNICGFPNKPDDRLACKGKDQTDEKYLLIDTNGKNCVKACESKNQITPEAGFLCVDRENHDADETFGEITKLSKEFIADLQKSIWKILIVMVFACALSGLTLVLFRYFIKYIVYLILLVVGAVLIALTIWLWTNYLGPHDERHEKSGLLLIIFMTILAIGFPILIYVFRKEIRFTIRLLKEAAKAIIDMSLLMLVPYGTTILLVTTVYLWIQFVIMIASAGVFEVVDGKANYKHNGAMVAAQIFNCFGFFWFTQFLFGCQHLIVSGAVGKWFFTRNKENTNGFVLMSTDNLIRFHLGTAAFGSLVSIFIKIVRAIFKGIRDSLKNRGGCEDLLCGVCDTINQFLEYLAKTAFICTAMFGLPFYQAGRKAFNVLIKNASDIIIVKTVGNMVMATGKIFIVLGSTTFAIAILGGTLNEDTEVFIYILVAGLTYLLAHCFISVFEMALDTLFISFCVDCERNDGHENPYYMSVKLVKFLEDTNILKKDGYEGV